MTNPQAPVPVPCFLTPAATSFPSSQQMHMQVNRPSCRHRRPYDDDSVALASAFLRGEIRRNPQQMPQEGGMLLACFGQRNKMLARCINKCTGAWG